MSNVSTFAAAILDFVQNKNQQVNHFRYEYFIDPTEYLVKVAHCTVKYIDSES